MPRPSKDDVEPVSLAKLSTVLARLKHVVESIETVASDLAKDEVLYVSYAKSLDRGIERLEAFEPQLRKSLALARHGSPLQPRKTGQTQVSEIDRQAAEAIAETAPLVPAPKPKALPEPKSKRKRG